MKSKDIRTKWIQYFQDKREHLHLPSASLVPNNPTLLLTNAGMVPFVPYFLGQEKPPSPRAVTVQKCVRVGGKDSDLENIGKTPRHLTFFEMLGNFSFGDYFKEEVIPWSWELLTEVYGFKPENLLVSIFAGDELVAEDTEALNIWHKKVGVPENRILKMGRADNFWGPPGGISGPCGPCSEIYYDPGDGSEPIEIWNLVFMQYEKFEDGSLKALPKPNVDTGAGLERMATILQGKETVFETDLMEPLIQKVKSLKHSAEEGRLDLSVKIIADHLRCSSMLIADGVKPSNLGRGYVLRMLIRRAARFAWLIGLKDPFLASLVPTVQEIFAGTYPELDSNVANIQKQLTAEEEAFNKTIDRGLQKFNEIVSVHVTLNSITPQPPCKGESKSLVLDESLHESGVFKYNTKLLEQAKQMRENPTQAEQVLWDECLRSSKAEYKFTRQKPIDNFILDFYCSELLLAIEADGEIHDKSKEQDSVRDEKLNQLGIKVLRLTNNQILDETEKVKSLIKTEIENREKELEKQQPNKLPLTRGLGGNKINGEAAFDLYATYGFPVELTVDLAEEKGLSVDLEAYQKAKDAHSEVSNQGKFAVGFKAERNEELQNLPATEFIGYESQSCNDAKVLMVIDSPDNENEAIIILDKTTLYAEGGGQKADKGIISSQGRGKPNEKIFFHVSDVQKQGEVFLHKGYYPDSTADHLKAGDQVISTYNFSPRHETAKHHTATHLLHAALRRVTNNETEQRGSLVTPERLRFDFACSKKLSEKELEFIEESINEIIKQKCEVKTEILPIKEAIEKGAMAFFGDKYGEDVRVLSILPPNLLVRGNSETPSKKAGEVISIELCGGTHVKNTSEIQGFKIVSESAISAGVRRIEAVAGQAYIDYLRESDKQLDEMKVELKVPREKVAERVKELIESDKQKDKKVTELEKQLVKFKAEALLDEIKEINGIKVLVTETDLTALKDALDFISTKLQGESSERGILVEYVLFLASKEGPKISYAAKTSTKVRTTAKDLVAQFASSIGGSGGGRPDFAQGGGGEVSKFENALAEVKSTVFS
jgi:alanyl-tRNA synthetase